MQYLELPEPWIIEELGLSEEDEEQLELLVGARIEKSKLKTPDDITVYTSENLVTPISRRAHFVYGHKWERLHNKKTAEEVLIRFQSRAPESKEWGITSVVAPFQNDGADISGATLRQLPLGKIAAIYSAHKIQGTININRTMALGESIKSFDPFKPLGPGRLNNTKFLAQAGIQYDAIKKKYPRENATRKMKELNDVALPTVHAWLSTARKMGYLAPVPKGGKQ